MLTALGVIAVLLLVGATALNLAHLEGLIARRHVQELQVSYLAEAGIERTRAMIFHDPSIVGNLAADYRLEIDEPELRGQALVTVTRPTLNGLLTVRSEARLAGGPRKIWQATMTAPPDYELYCRRVQLNPALEVAGLLNRFGVACDGPWPELEGDLQVSPLSRGAYQEFAGDGLYFPEDRHTHRYQPPAVEMSFWRQAAGSETIDWGAYAFSYSEHSVALPSAMKFSIYAVNGDVLIYSGLGPIDLQNCLVIATGDIWIVNPGGGPSDIEGLYLAGRDVNLYQGAGDMQVKAGLCAARNVNLCCGGPENRIYLAPWDQIPGLPAVLRGKLGFLSIRSYQELAV